MTEIGANALAAYFLIGANAGCAAIAHFAPADDAPPARMALAFLGGALVAAFWPVALVVYLATRKGGKVARPLN